jgi:hypothetical protein
MWLVIDTLKVKEIGRLYFGKIRQEFDSTEHTQHHCSGRCLKLPVSTFRSSTPI